MAASFMIFARTEGGFSAFIYHIGIYYYWFVIVEGGALEDAEECGREKDERLARRIALDALAFYSAA